MDQANVILDDIQRLLSCKELGRLNPQFSGNGNGKIGTTGYVLGILGGFHIGAFFILSIVETNNSCFLYTLVTNY